MLFSVLTRASSQGTAFLLRGPGPGKEEADLSWRVFGARSPDPVVIAEEARHPEPRLSGHPTGRHRSHRLCPMQTATAIRLQRQGWGEVHLSLKDWAWPVGTHLMSGTPSSSACPKLGEGWDLPLTSLSAGRPPF